MPNRRSVLGLFLGAGLAALGAAAPAVERAPLPPPRPAGLGKPAAEPGAALRERLRLAGRSGWMLVDLDSGEVLDAQDAEATFAPASVAKLPTALYALALLGPAHRFETRLMATGPVEAGTVRGDLVLAGGGDPELDTDGLDALVAQAVGRGLRRVTGGLAVSAAGLPSLPAIDPAQPVDVAYNPAVSALSLNYNRVFLRWGARPATDMAVTAKAAVLDPPVTRVRVEVAPGAAAPFAHALGATGETWRLAPATVQRAGSRWLPVREPAPYAGEVLRTLAAARGVALPQPAPGAAPAGATVIAALESRPLPGILRDMLHHSTNLTAEMVGLAATRAGGMEVEALAQSATMMNAWVAQVTGNAPGDARIRLLNHSGLNADSRVAPSRMVALLRAAAAMPVAGMAAHPRLPGPAAALLRPYALGQEDGSALPGFEVVAKTGTMDRIRGLAGYIVTEGGRRLAFAIFSNDLAGREGARREIAQGWMGRARSFERALIQSWVARFDARLAAAR